MEHLSDILLYLFVFIISSLLISGGLKIAKNNRFGIMIILVGILIPSIMAGIRYMVGADYPTYLKMFNNVVNGREMYFRPIEPASAAIINVSAHFGNSAMMFFLFNFFTNIFFYFAFWRLFKNNNKQVAISYFFYLCLLYSTTLNAMRSSVAISLCMVAFSYFLQDWTKKTVIIGSLFIVLAFLFHNSALFAILFIPVFWISKKHSGYLLKTKKTILWLLYFIVAMILPRLFPLWGESDLISGYSRYLNGFGNAFSVPLADIMLIALVLWGVVYYSKNKNVDMQQKSLLYCTTFYIPMAISVGWFTYVDGLSRISFMLIPLVICLMTYMITQPKRLGSLRDLMTIAIILVATSLMLVRNLNWSLALPYRTIELSEVSYASEN